jgi:hypothetical protein
LSGLFSRPSVQIKLFLGATAGFSRPRPNSQNFFPTPFPYRQKTKKRKMSKAIKGITRIEYEGITTRGWMVRITRGGVRQQKFFNDKAFGGKAKSLKAAKDCYAEWLANAAPIATSRNRKTSRNSSGKVGVHTVRNVDYRWANAESFGYCASWVTEDGVRQKLSFAWKLYGKKAAWNLACIAREKELTDREKVVKLYQAQQSRAKKAK